MEPKRRAISDAQKAQRRQAILDIGWQLFTEKPYEAINISEVAERAGLAKGTFYLYFKTKEALFLAVLMEQFNLWFDEVDRLLDETAEDYTADRTAALFTDTLNTRPALARLFAIVHIVLEHNIDYDAALRFKQLLRERVLATGQRLENRLPFLQPGQGAEVLLRAYALLIGVQHLSDPAPVVQQVLAAEPDLALFCIDFTHEFSHTLQALIRSYQEN